MVMIRNNDRALNGALNALSRGWPVVVIPPNKKYPTMAWQRLQESPPSEAEVRGWFENEPNSNYGIITTELVVLDCDVHSEEANGLDTLRELASGHEKIHTPVLKTWSGGLHYYFRKPEHVEVKNSVGKVGAGLDIRAVGGLVVGEGSIVNGKAYEWIDGRSIDDIPLADVPNGLLIYS